MAQWATLDGWLWHCIFHQLSPRNLIYIAAVSKRMYCLARANAAWQGKKARLIQYCPDIAHVFDAYPSSETGKAIAALPAPGSAHRGTWFVFARFLLPMRHYSTRWLEGFHYTGVTEYMVRAMIQACFTAQKSVVTSIHFPHTDCAEIQTSSGTYLQGHLNFVFFEMYFGKFGDVGTLRMRFAERVQRLADCEWTFKYPTLDLLNVASLFVDFVVNLHTSAEPKTAVVFTRRVE
jgi:hypothetical protein